MKKSKLRGVVAFIGLVTVFAGVEAETFAQVFGLSIGGLTAFVWGMRPWMTLSNG